MEFNAKISHQRPQALGMRVQAIFRDAFWCEFDGILCIFDGILMHFGDTVQLWGGIWMQRFKVHLAKGKI